MTALKRAFIGATVVAAVGYGIYQAHEASRLRDQVQSLQQEKTRLTAQLRKEGGRGLSAGPWLDRMNRVQQWLAQNPGESIPEIQFASTSAWLNSLQFQIETEDDLRRASSLLRNQAQMKFCGFIADAVRQYEQASNGQFPANLSQLVPYCDASVGGTMTQLYEIKPAGTVKDPGFDAQGDWIITRKASANPGLSQRVAVLKNGRRAWYDAARN